MKNIILFAAIGFALCANAQAKASTTHYADQTVFVVESDATITEVSVKDGVVYTIHNVSLPAVTGIVIRFNASDYCHALDLPAISKPFYGSTLPAFTLPVNEATKPQRIATKKLKYFARSSC